MGSRSPEAQGPSRVTPSAAAAGDTPALPHEAAAGLQRLGFDAVCTRLLSPLGSAKGRRCAWRVEDGRGHVRKARLFEDDRAAHRACALRTGLERDFAAVLGHDGALVVEEWIDGRPLGADEMTPALEWAGALLARLHARPLPAGEDDTVEASAWVDGARTDLARIRDAGLVEDVVAERASRIVRDLAPRRCRTALTHLDLCPDNLVVDPAGRFRVIDNEMFAVRPPGFDLARSFHLWPMNEAAWGGFLEAYRASGGAVAEDLDFWRLVALALGTRIFFDRDPVRRDDAVLRLRALVDRLDPDAARAPGTRRRSPA